MGAKNMKSHAFLAAAAAALLSACQSAYVEPPAGERTARLRILQIGGDNTVIQKLKAACLTTDKNARNFGDHYEKIARFSGVSDASDQRRLNMPDAPAAPVKFTEVVVDATQPFLLGYDATRFVSGYPQSMVYTCVMGVSFKPEPGADYEAVVSRASDTQCRLDLRRLVPRQGAVAREAVAGAQTIRGACL
jgi:hypothetical protein